ncbi:2Fe-2S iron-sulfur cluster-binding protein [Halobaculum sp. MBLA0143]|uniref:2Fe-2S iron-sulfur cluster-binding protein n=1 Tax=Halobaculum sp. MBLA0143 TaxID=3079933 RepID=UPI003524F4D5
MTDDATDDPTTDDDATDDPTTVTVHQDGETTEVSATSGEPLRDALLRADLSPYTRLTERANCGGRGLCATCGVRLRSEESPGHWHDRLADRFGYPRLSCQIPVADGLEVVLVDDKRVWGGRE